MNNHRSSKLNEDEEGEEGKGPEIRLKNCLSLNVKIYLRIYLGLNLKNIGNFLNFKP